jgi:hypothetical protein
MTEHRNDDGKLGAQGPSREEMIEQQRDRDRPEDAADDQTNASDSAIGDRDETGTGRRAEEAATRRSEPSHLGEAEHAFEQSRGEDRRRNQE